MFILLYLLYLQIYGNIKNSICCNILEAGPYKIGQIIMCLPYKNEDPCEKLHVSVYVYNPSAGEEETEGFLGLISQLVYPNW